MRWRPSIVTLITTTVLVLVTYIHKVLSFVATYRELHRHYPFYLIESVDKITGVILCIVAIWLIRPTNLRGIARDLGLDAPVLPAIAFALVASSPMLIGFAITRSLTTHIQFLPLLFLTVFSPLVEEIEFRGFGVRQLQRGTGWLFWATVWPSAILFGLGHIEQGQTLQEKAILFLLLGAGGVTFAWLVYRWQNLWVCVALHIAMNLSWELFSVSKTTIGGWLPFALQSLTIMLAILITLYWTKAVAVTARRNSNDARP
jgi:membrane protease YdiL (CAAX protease family)